MIPDYDTLNVEETIEAVSGFGADRLVEFLEYERDHQNRSTLINPLEDELVQVRPADGRSYVAGVWFDEPSEAQTVRRSPRIERAIDDGLLEVIGDE